MRVIREVLRLAWSCGFNQRQVSISCNIARSSVQDCLLRAKGAKLSWPLPDDLDDTKLESLLYKPMGRPKSDKAPIDFAYLHRELHSHKGMTMGLLWQRYIERDPEGYQYSYFCTLFNEWAGKLDLVMKQEHLAGEKVFSDFAGSTLKVTSLDTGEVNFVKVFVCCLGASSYTFAKAYWSENAEAWCMGHAEAFSFFGGCPEIVVPDNPKPVVTKACPYEPDIHMDFLHMAQHFGVGVVPARVRKPKDKAKVEAAVKMATRWIIAVLKDRTFHSLAELNLEIAKLLEILNTRPFKKMPGSRRSAFEAIDRPALKALPQNRYEYTQNGFAKSHLDYHITIDDCQYSVPFQYAKKKLEYRLSTKTLEIFYRGNRIASHVRRLPHAKPATVKEHMPPNHQAYLDWTPERFIAWATKIGPDTKSLIEAVLGSREFPQQAFKSCLGILHLTKDYSDARLERAASCALRVRGFSYKTVKLILENQQENRPVDRAPGQLKIFNPNVRGPLEYALINKESTDANSPNH